MNNIRREIEIEDFATMTDSNDFDDMLNVSLGLYEVNYKATEVTKERATRILNNLNRNKFSNAELQALFPELNSHFINIFEPVWEYLSRRDNDGISEALHFECLKKIGEYRLITEKEWEREQEEKEKIWKIFQ